MRSVGGRSLTLEGLLAAQAATMRVHPAFPKLVASLHESAALARLRLAPMAYRLLNTARLEDRHLANFYVTYHLPPSPFFPLFLAVKRECEEKREAATEARGRRILAIMENYPEDVLGLVKYLAKVERERNANFPVWKKKLFPRTLKRARELQSFDLKQWLSFLSAYMEELRAQYRRLPLPASNTLFACMLLRCMPEAATGQLPGITTIERGYCALRAAYTGGSAEERRRLPLLAASREVLMTAAAGSGGLRPHSPSPRAPS